MKYQRQHDVSREREARIPRGDLLQNLFRSAWTSFRMHGHTFDESVTVATAVIRKDDPGFVPRILSAGE
jgi:hypothetical protein